MAQQQSFIIFNEYSNKGTTKSFNVVSKTGGSVLGKILWYSHWRRYCYFPEENIVLDAGCMLEITNFLNALMVAYKADLQQRQQNKL